MIKKNLKGKLNSTGNQSIKNGYEDMLFLTTINCSQPLFIIEIRGSQSYSLLGGFGSKKNKKLLPILDCIIKHEQQCVYYTPNLIFNIYSRNLNDSIDEVQIGAIGSILTRLELDEKCFEYAGHLFLVERYKNSLFINTNQKKQISYYIETNNVVINYYNDTYSFWIYHYISDRFFFRDMYDTYCKPTRSQYGR